MTPVTVPTRRHRHPPNRDRHAIDPIIYGHFLESAFFGNIEGGVFDEGSPLSVDEPGARNGLRSDVIDALPGARRADRALAGRQLHLAVPLGGRHRSARRPAAPAGAGLGKRGEPTASAPTSSWPGAREVGAEPYLVHSCPQRRRGGPLGRVHQLRRRHRLPRQRAANGHPDPYGVRYWGSATRSTVLGRWAIAARQQYAADAASTPGSCARSTRRLQFVAVGADRRRQELDRDRARAGGRSCRLPLVPPVRREHTTLRRPGDDYDAIVAQPLYFEQQIDDYADLVARTGRPRAASIGRSHWRWTSGTSGTWSRPAGPSRSRRTTAVTPPSVSCDGAPTAALRVNRWSPRTLADALFYAGVFHALHRLSACAVPVDDGEHRQPGQRQRTGRRPSGRGWSVRRRTTSGISTRTTPARWPWPAEVAGPPQPGRYGRAIVATRGGSGPGR